MDQDKDKTVPKQFFKIKKNHTRHKMIQFALIQKIDYFLKK